MLQVNDMMQHEILVMLNIDLILHNLTNITWWTNH